MCDDLERAKKNRYMVAKKLYIWAYLQMENWLAANPQGDMPEWVYTDGFEKVEVRGGKARMAKLTPKEKSELGKKAANKRWHAS